MKSLARLNAIALAVLLLGSAHLRGAETSYLPANVPDGVELLPPPPTPGSAESVAELNEVRAVFHARTEAEKARAFKDATLSFSLWTSIIGPDFDLTKLPKTSAFLKKVKTDIQEPINAPKDFYKRSRPYVLDPSLNIGKPERSFSYPSGHSTRGTVYAMVIADLFPEKREAILELGRTIGWDRVLIGVHFPTDINAGRILARAIVKELKKSPDYQRDFAAAKAEIAALRGEPVLSGAGK